MTILAVLNLVLTASCVWFIVARLKALRSETERLSTETTALGEQVDRLSQRIDLVASRPPREEPPKPKSITSEVLDRSDWGYA